MDAEVEKMLKANPLAKFSPYTQVQFDALMRLGDEIKVVLAATITQSGKNAALGPGWIKAYDYFWFWTLGAYEVLRTMDQHAHCFAPVLATKIKAHKQYLAKIRMPFAKQELSGNGGPIWGENSFTEVKNGSLQFRIEGKTYDMVRTIDKVMSMLSSIKLSQVKGRLP